LESRPDKKKKKEKEEKERATHFNRSPPNAGRRIELGLPGINLGSPAGPFCHKPAVSRLLRR
jgi:hypothetical protein